MFFNHTLASLFNLNVLVWVSFVTVRGWNQIGTIICCLFPQVEADESSKEQIKMASQEESVKEFVAVTDVDEERARFFLESAGWNLQVSLSCIFPLSCGGLWDQKSKGNSGDRTCVRRIARRLTLACVAGNLCKSPFDNGLAAFCPSQQGCCAVSQPAQPRLQPGPFLSSHHKADLSFG